MSPRVTGLLRTALAQIKADARPNVEESLPEHSIWVSSALDCDGRGAARSHLEDSSIGGGHQERVPWNPGIGRWLRRVLNTTEDYLVFIVIERSVM